MKVSNRHAHICILWVILLSTAANLAAQQKAAPVPKPAVPFVDDDYARALADAQKRNVPLFVDL